MTDNSLRRIAKWFAIAAGVGAVAFLGVASGVAPITASSGHWAITNWFLHFAMQRSVATHALGVESKQAKERWAVLKGAGHFETACRPCHGAPDLRPPLILQKMTPPPPYLSPTMHGWQPEELFYIVKHGIKFTAMPAWPSQQRDDEVWAMVAFLRELPKLDAADYRALVHGTTQSEAPAEAMTGDATPEASPTAVVASCARCHGARGEARGSAAFPKLAGQKSGYQVAALRAYAEGKRHSGIMQPIAMGMTLSQMQTASSYYAAQRPEERPYLDARDPARAASWSRGENIAKQGLPQQGVPACSECHSPSANARNASYPNLARQYADYLVLQLELFRSGRRGGSPYAHLMELVASRLTEEQMRDVALYYQSQSL